MTQSPENEPTETCQTNDDPDNWLHRVKLLFERAVFACSQIVAFSEEVASTEQHSSEVLYRFKMMPTEMIVAMHNLRTGIEDALLGLAALGLPPELGERGNELFVDKKEGEDNTNLDRLFHRVVEDGGPNGFLPVGKIKFPADSGVDPEEYQGSLDYLKEMAGKYQIYDFENVPKGMAGACRKRGLVVDPFVTEGNKNESCSHLQNPQSAGNAIDLDEVIKYKKMCEELIEDANIIFGQFGAIGSIYRAANK